MTKERTSSDAIQTHLRDQRIAELEAQLRERDALIAKLEEQIRQLQEQVEGAKRAGKRQPAPFAREKRSSLTIVSSWADSLIPVSFSGFSILFSISSLMDLTLRI